jgi:hypothetical protein
LSNQESQKESPSEEHAAANAFAPENFGPVVLIQLMRLYDVQMALLSCYDAEKAQALALMHEQGLTFTPPPAYAVQDEEDEA